MLLKMILISSAVIGGFAPVVAEVSDAEEMRLDLEEGGVGKPVAGRPGNIY